jgi:hypothetical protein
MPDAQPIFRPPDDSAADIASLVRLGLAEPQPVPEPPSTSPFVEPTYPDPVDQPDDEPA